MSAPADHDDRVVHESARTETQCIESHLARDRIVDVLVEPRRIPGWAPDFADRVVGDSRLGWRAIKEGRSVALHVVIDRSAGTVDYLREIGPGRRGGAYLRAMPRPGGGSVIVMTVPRQPGVEADRSAAILTRELRALVALADVTR